jgi:hypothetical protein
MVFNIQDNVGRMAQNEDKQNKQETTQKTKTMNITDPHKKRG